MVVFRRPEFRCAFDGVTIGRPSSASALIFSAFASIACPLVQRIDRGRIGEAPVAELATVIRRVRRTEQDARPSSA